MILLPEYKGRKVAVMGLGLSGRATVASLAASGAEVFAWDESEDHLKHCQSQYRDVVYSDFHKWPWKEIEVLVLSPGVPLHYPQPHPIVGIATVYGCEILGDVELLMQSQTEAAYVGITGTNGKSTTTALVGHLLQTLGKKVQVGGNIGTAPLDLSPLGPGGIYVLEMSSYQLDLMVRSTFDVSVLLNISPDHLDRHGGMEGYVAAKRRIFDGMGVQDTAVISVDDEHSRQTLKDLKEGKSLYSWQDAKPQLVPISVDDDCPIDLSNIATLQGIHNKQNALAAIAVCNALGIKTDKLKKGFKTFTGLAHRMQPLGQKDGVQFVNDSKATNADAASHALETYDNIYWILGGRAKDGGIDSLEEYFPKIARAYLIGEAADDFSKTLRKKKVKCEKSKTLSRAVDRAYADAREAGGGVVLLAPACASFDQFASFEERGEYFTTQVNRILEPEAAEETAEGDAA